MKRMCHEIVWNFLFAWIDCLSDVNIYKHTTPGMSSIKLNFRVCVKKLVADTVLLIQDGIEYNYLVITVLISHYTYLLAVHSSHNFLFCKKSNSVFKCCCSWDCPLPQREFSTWITRVSVLSYDMGPPFPFPFEMAPPSLFLSTLAPAPAPLYLSKT
jgi:hypothetical protein